MRNTNKVLQRCYVLWVLVFAGNLCLAQRPRSTGAAAQRPSGSGLPVEHRVQTSSPEAQRLFDQGLTLIYALDYSGAAKSFEHAAALDPKMAMSYWGIAYATGSDYYYATPGDPKRESRAREALRHAFTLAQMPEVEHTYLA